MFLVSEVFIVWNAKYRMFGGNYKCKINPPNTRKFLELYSYLHSLTHIFILKVIHAFPEPV